MVYEITHEAPRAFQGFCPITPVPKGRPRFTRNGIAYTPKPTREYETAVRNWAKETYGLHTEPMDGTLGVRLEFVIQRPKAAKDAWFSNKKPDVDNFVKGFLDALDFKEKSTDGKALGVFANDSRIATMSSAKRYAVDDEETGTSFVIFHADETAIVTDDRIPSCIDPTIRVITSRTLTLMRKPNNDVKRLIVPSSCSSIVDTSELHEKFPSASIELLTTMTSVIL